MLFHRFDSGRVGVCRSCRKKETVALVIGAADAAAELVELGEAETLSAFDDNDRGIGDVDAHFDDGGRDEDVALFLFELPHGFFFLFRSHLTVEESDAAVLEGCAEARDFCFDGFKITERDCHVTLRDRLEGRPAIFFLWLDERANHEDLPPLPYAAVDEGFDRATILWTCNFCMNLSAISRFFCKHREIVVTIRSESESARDGGCGHGENMGTSFLFELLALEDAEAVLFVDDCEEEILEDHVFLNECVRADDEVDCSIGQARFY